MNKYFFDVAFSYAQKAFLLGEVPVGAVIVKDDHVISYGYNTKEFTFSVLNHAEIMAIRMAEEVMHNWRLEGCDIYVTLDPCPMCASAIQQSRIRNVYSALSNSDKNNSLILEQIFKSNQTNPATNFTSNLDTIRSKKLLNSFFQKRREK